MTVLPLVGMFRTWTRTADRRTESIKVKKSPDTRVILEARWGRSAAMVERTNALTWDRLIRRPLEDLREAVSGVAGAAVLESMDGFIARSLYQTRFPETALLGSAPTSCGTVPG